MVVALGRDETLSFWDLAASSQHSADGTVRDWGAGRRVKGVECRVKDVECRVKVVGRRVSSEGCRV